MILYMYTSACQPVFTRLTQVLPLIFFHAKVEVWMDHMKWHPAREVNDWSSPTPCEELLKICGILIHAKLPKPKKNLKENIWLINIDIVWLTYVSTYFMLDLSRDVDAHQQNRYHRSGFLHGLTHEINRHNITASWTRWREGVLKECIWIFISFRRFQKAKCL